MRFSCTQSKRHSKRNLSPGSLIELNSRILGNCFVAFRLTSALHRFVYFAPVTHTLSIPTHPNHVGLGKV